MVVARPAFMALLSIRSDASINAGWVPGFLLEIRHLRSVAIWRRMFLGRKYRVSASVLPLRRPTVMSPIARVLHDRFEEICRAELSRLRRKTASLSVSDRGELDDISLSVVRAIAARLGDALEQDTAPDTGSIVTHLFAVTPGEQGR